MVTKLTQIEWNNHQVTLIDYTAIKTEIIAAATLNVVVGILGCLLELLAEHVICSFSYALFHFLLLFFVNLGGLFLLLFQHLKSI